MSFIANIIFINMSTSLRWNPPFHEFPQIFQQDGAQKNSLDSVAKDGCGWILWVMEDITNQYKPGLYKHFFTNIHITSGLIKVYGAYMI